MPPAIGQNENAYQGAAARSAAAWLGPLLLVIITAVAFLPALEADFLNWDDPNNITNNDHYRGLGAEQIRWAFTTFHMGHYQPLSWLTLGLDYVIWGPEPFGYHLTNLLLHICNGLLVYALVLRLFRLAGSPSPGEVGPTQDHMHGAGRLVGALLAAALFSVHPMRVESVAWVTERRDVLSAALYLLTIHLYLTARSRPGRAAAGWWTAGAVLVFILAVLAKVMSVSLVLVLLILDAYPLGRLGGNKGWLNARVLGVWAEKIPFLLVALAGAALAFLAQSESTSIMSWSAFGLRPRLAVSAYGLVFYLYKTVWPVTLCPLYELPAPVDPFEGRFVFCATLVIAGAAGMVMLRRRRPAAGSALAATGLAYVVILLPVSGMFQNGPQIVASRYSYLSCIGWAVLIGAVFSIAWRRWDLRGGRLLLSLIAGAIVVGLSLLTWQENKTWQNSLSLWNKALRVDPACGFCHENLAEALVNAGRTDQAMEVYRNGLKLRPHMERSLVGLATLLEEKGEPAGALELYGRALKIRPEYAGAHYNLAMLLTEMGRRAEAMKHYRLAMRYDPGDVRAYGNLGNLLSEANRTDEAIEIYHQALQAKPSAAGIRRNLGLVLARKGDLAAAEEQLRRALGLRPDDAEALNNLGVVLDRLERPEEAARAYREALRLRPDYARARYNLGLLLVRAGQDAEAGEHFREALGTAPNLVEARLGLADLLAEQDRCDEAVELLREGLRLAPANLPLAERLAHLQARCNPND